MNADPSMELKGHFGMIWVPLFSYRKETLQINAVFLSDNLYPLMNRFYPDDNADIR